MNEPPDEGEDFLPPPPRAQSQRPRREPPAYQPPPLRQPRPVKGDGGSRYNIKAVAIAAFIFGVALHGCVALSVLSSDSGANDDQTNDSPLIIETPSNIITDATLTPTTLPDRTTCDEIRGTEYRSNAERDFFRQNCVTGGAAPTQRASSTATPTVPG